jgi:hypothetical protein
VILQNYYIITNKYLGGLRLEEMFVYIYIYIYIYKYIWIEFIVLVIFDLSAVVYIYIYLYTYKVLERHKMTLVSNFLLFFFEIQFNFYSFLFQIVRN